MSTFKPGGFPRYKHQKRAVKKMIENKGVYALLFDPGTGKSSPTVDFMSLLTLNKKYVRVLVVCPNLATDTWIDHIKTCASPQISWWAEVLGGSVPHICEAIAARSDRPFRKRYTKVTRNDEEGRMLHHRKATSWGSSGVESLNDDINEPQMEVIVVASSTFSQKRLLPGSKSRTSADLLQDAVERYEPDLLVLDEAHIAKSPASNLSHLLRRVAKKIPRRILLTGTVLAHSALDVWSQWAILEPDAFSYITPSGERKPMTYGMFQDRYAIMGGFQGKEVKGFQRLDEMQNIMSENSMAVRKSDALDLPTTTEVILPITLSDTEAKAYNDFKEELSTSLDDGTLLAAPNRLVQMVRLRQITAGYINDENSQPIELGTAKAKAIEELVHVKMAGENRLVIFAQFTKEIEILVRELSRKGTEILQITGATPPEARREMRHRFGSDDPARLVMVAQTATMSMAVNELVTASHAIFSSMPMRRAEWVQAKDRLNRIGQKLPVTYWYPMVEGTLDKVILTAHRNRDNLEDAVLDHIRQSNPL